MRSTGWGGVSNRPYRHRRGGLGVLFAGLFPFLLLGWGTLDSTQSLVNETMICSQHVRESVCVCEEHIRYATRYQRETSAYHGGEVSADTASQHTKVIQTHTTCSEMQNETGTAQLLHNQYESNAGRTFIEKKESK